MNRKRELVVEKWCKHEIEFAEWIAKHPEGVMDMPEDIVDGTIGEVLMAKGFHECGMQVYEFDQDFAESILAEDWSELLPDVIDYVPHYAFYIKLPFNGTNEGCVVTVTDEYEVINGSKYKPEFDRAEKGVYPIFGADMSTYVGTGEKVLLVSGFAIPKDFGLMFDDTPLGTYPRELLLNALAYLCSANSDIAAVYSPTAEKRRNNAKRRSQATWHEVGYRIGAELRNYNRTKHKRGEKTGRTVRPHMRRAHWHRFWVGPRDGDRRLVLKWLAPTMVGTGIESATGHKVY